MRWRGGEQSGNLEDRRSMGGAGMVLGGGGAIVLVVLGLIFGIDPNQINQLVNEAQQGQQGPARPLTAEEEEQKAFAATVLKFTEEVWTEQFRKIGKQYDAPKMVLFTDRVQSGCGIAPSAVGPFYCPADRMVYLDPTFFVELEQKLGGSKAEFSQAYVIAHEIGHHVQNLLGYSDQVHAKRNHPDSKKWSVRLELQADYLAGVWAYHGQKKFNFIEPGDIEAAITSANAIGDDRLQKNSTGFTSPEKYTHGTSEQRVKWFKLGFETGDFNRIQDLFELPYEQL